LVLAWAAGQIAGLLGGSTIPPAVVVQAAVFGCINALFAVGLVLVYRASRVINFAHTSFGVVASTTFLLLTTGEGLSFWIAAPVSIAVGGLFGVLVELLLIRRFAKASRMVLTVVTIAAAQLVAFASRRLPRLFFEPDEALPRDPASTPFSNDKWEWFPVIFRGDHLIVVIGTVAVLAAMVAFFRFTSIGVAIRAAAENGDRAALLGINTGSLSSLVWLLAASLAAVAAILQAPLDGATLAAAAGSASAGIGAGNLLRALTAAVLGRMENLPVTVAAAIGIAVFEQSVFWAFTESAITDLVLLGVIIAVLLIQRKKLGRTDEGITGTWAATEEIRQVPSELQNHPQVRAGIRRTRVLLVVLALAYPWVMSPSQTNAGSLYAIYGVVAISLVVLTGWGGQISLGQFGFVAVGAVVGGAMTARWGWPFLIALPAASALGAAVAVAVGLPALRIKGLFLAVTTMAFSVVTASVLLNDRYFGWLLPTSVPRPKLLWVNTAGEREFYYLTLVCLGIAIFLARGVRQSRTGRVLIAMRDNERAAQAFSMNLVRTRLATFALSGFLASMAGVLYAHHQLGVSQEAFAPERSIQMFLMAVIGGLGSIGGVLTGAAYLGGVDVLAPDLSFLASGAGVVLVLLLYPGGLGALVFAVRDAWLRRIAIRDRISVPSLVGDFRLEKNEVPLAPKFDSQGGENATVPVRYRKKTIIGDVGSSQRSGAWRY